MNSRIPTQSVINEQEKLVSVVEKGLSVVATT